VSDFPVWCRFLGRRGGDGAAHSIKTASEKRPGTKSRLGRRQRRGWLYGDYMSGGRVKRLASFFLPILLFSNRVAYRKHNF
jgi:hypothetical protein